MLGIFHDFCGLLLFLKKKNQEYHKCVDEVWIHFRPILLWSLIWVQTVCKDYKQIELAGRVKNENVLLTSNSLMS